MPIVCDILNTGSELVLGRTLNRHGAWFGQKLFLEGIEVRRALVLPDGPIIQEEMARSLAEADLVLVTGGLGPTNDDLTREYACACLGVGMELDPVSYGRIEARLAARGRVCGENQRRQAMVPHGAMALANDHGTAPGLAFAGRDALPGQKARLLCLLPGPPRELHPMFNQQVLPLLEKLFAAETHRRRIREYHFVGIGEGELAEKLDPLVEPIPGLEIGYCAHNTGTMELRLVGDESALSAGDGAVRPALGPEFYSDSDADLARALVGLLRERGQTIATAESCTGGAVASALTDVPGASNVFGHGFVTYANEAKSNHLVVEKALLETHGAVSEEVALAMAKGALAASGANIALSLTGIAGPDGGTEEKPVGTLWVGLARSDGFTLARRHRFLCDRATFKRLAVTQALDFARRNLG
ncbi:MAG: CinA family nicotinamide mononucleotide deamidase-related protein [Verrucomicrobiales bacterium]